MNKIKLVSRFFNGLFFILLFVLPLLVAMYWITDGVLLQKLVPFGISFRFLPADLSHLSGFSPTIKFFGFLISMLPTGVSMVILYFLIKLFARFKTGEIFSIENIKYLKKIGYTILTGQIIIHPIYDALIYATLTYGRKPHMIAITFGTPQLKGIVTGILIILIAWILQEGYKLQQEQVYTV